MPPPIKKLADKFLTNPKYIEVARPATANTNIEQFLVNVSPMKKRDVLRDLIRSEQVSNAIIFCNRKTTVRELNTSLQRHGLRSGEIHGDIDQASRQKQLEAFKNGDIDFLVASDVAARGLDVKGVSHVFNFDAPWHPDDYVHRIGRTGRAGAKGKAFTFVTKADEEAIDNIEKLIGNKIERLGQGDASDAVKAERAPAKRSRKAVADEPLAEPENSPPKSARADKKPTREKPAAPQKAAETESDNGWNGPMPGFLGVGFGS
jgi:superfamily II DNA/RNA helicase